MVAWRGLPRITERERTLPILNFGKKNAEHTMESLMSDAKEVVEMMPAAFDANAAGDTSATIQFAISTPMHVIIHAAKCSASEGEAENPDVTLKMKDQDLIDLLNGKLNGMTAFMTGKLQVDGDLMLAQKLPYLFDSTKLS